MNLPNALTIARMFLVPLLVVVLLTEFEGRQVLGVMAIWLGGAGRLPGWGRSSTRLPTSS
jgi:phosphatidylglycerophosphate synthase